MDGALQDDDVLEGLLETSVIDNILTQNITPPEDITAANNRIISRRRYAILYSWSELRMVTITETFDDYHINQ